MTKFKLKSQYKPAGDQPRAIKQLTEGLEKEYKKQTLLGVTGSGKTFTIANVIEKMQMPTLVISHNKTLAAQLCNEFREFFPDNKVEYFVSYYDYYQPEAYMPNTDTYIEKEAQINKEIDRLRHACTQALLSRQDVIIVASVSAIYGLGSPKEYEKIVLHLNKGQDLNRQELTKQLIDMHFERTNTDLRLGQFRLRGQVLEIMPVNEEMIYRFEIGEKIEIIERIHPVTKKNLGEIQDAWFFPAKHYILDEATKMSAMNSIRGELKTRLKYFKDKGNVLEYERLKRKTNYDLEMIANIGYCNGIENYSRYFDGRGEGEPPFTLLDYFKYSSKNFLTVVDESHVTLPQIRGMYMGDKARKDVLIEHGFRLPSARDNRPLKSIEFNQKINKVVYMSATPAEEEISQSKQIVEQIVRPTGLVDPEVIIRPITGSGKNKSQIEDLMERIKDRVKKNEKVLITTLTKRMAEDLNDYLQNKKFHPVKSSTESRGAKQFDRVNSVKSSTESRGAKQFGRVNSVKSSTESRGAKQFGRVKVKYLHSEIDTIKRIEIITDLRKGKIDVIVGVNLLREGLDIPEVSLVAILDADKEGFLRNETSLVQTIGRAARNVNGQVIIYADKMTGSIKRAVEETDRRRKIQIEYNKKYKITPKTIEKNIRNILEEFGLESKNQKNKKSRNQKRQILELDLKGDARPIEKIVEDKEEKMRRAAKSLEFELAAILRDEIKELRKLTVKAI